MCMTTEVKICGMTRAEDVAAALDAGADYVGFVFYPKSPRAVTADRARRILDAQAGPCRAVGVFVNASPTEVERVVRTCALYAAQLHGREEPAAFADCPVRLWRAVWPGGGVVRVDPAAWRAERYVVDAAVPGLYGGTGVEADWNAAAALAAARPVMLAGGLTPDNVAAAVAAVRPRGVDVSGGVETAPGRKDHAAVRAFVAQAKQASS